jgi:hypothetical protein
MALLRRNHAGSEDRATTLPCAGIIRIRFKGYFSPGIIPIFREQ